MLSSLMLPTTIREPKPSNRLVSSFKKKIVSELQMVFDKEKKEKSF